MKRIAIREELSIKEIDKMVKSLGTFLSLELKKKLKEARKVAEKLVVMENIQLPSLKMEAIKRLAKECTIVIPIHRLARDFREFSGEEFNAIEKAREIKKGFELTQEELAKLLSASPRTVAYWLHLESAPRQIYRDKISKVYDVYQEISGEVKPEALRKWLFVHNKLLRDSVYNLLVKGEFGRVLADIEALKEGVYV